MTVSSATARKIARATDLVYQASRTAKGAMTIAERRDITAWRSAARDFRLAAYLVRSASVPLVAVAERRRLAAALVAVAEVCREMEQADSPGTRQVLSVACDLASESVNRFLAALTVAHRQAFPPA